MKKVIGFGALNVDFIFKVENLNLEENPAYPVDVQAGGNAANTIAALAKLGIKCGFVGVVASDLYGKLILSELKKHKVNTSQITIRQTANSQVTSGIVETFFDKKGKRHLFVKPGVNSSLTEKEVDKNNFDSASIVHLTSFVQDQQFEIQKQLAATISSSVKISFAPGSLYCHRGLSQLEPIIKKTYILFLAQKEIYYLTGKSYRNGVGKLLDIGPKIVVVTLGASGCYVATSKKQILVPAKKVKVTDTTGAGDSLTAGFLYGLLNNYSIKKCAEIGNAMGSFSVQNIGARAGLPNRKELSSVVSLPK